MTIGEMLDDLRHDRSPGRVASVFAEKSPAMIPGRLPDLSHRSFDALATRASAGTTTDAGAADIVRRLEALYAELGGPLTGDE